MLVDRFGRKITYLRISVTDKCNYRCIYCMPEEGIELKPAEQILSFEDMESITREAARLGVRKVRLTGGEPLVRREIEKLVPMIAGCEGVEEVCMTTNGSLLTPEMAAKLKLGGLARVNISLDTLDAAEFARITRGGDIEDVLRGIEAAKEAGLEPVKINMIISETTTRDEVETMRSFCGKRGLDLQTIKLFSLYDRDEEAGLHLSFDRPMPCSACDKIRLTADGFFKPCLFSDNEIRADLENIENSIMEAVGAKPEKGTACVNRYMGEIGG